MIHINLLPVRAGKKQELGKQQLILFGVLLIGAVVGNVLWYNNASNRAENLSRQVSGLKDDIARVDRDIGEVKKYVAQKEALEQKLKVLDRLKKARTGPVKLLDAMANAIPHNVWIKKWSSQKNGAMSLEGSTVSNEDLAEFMKALANIVWTAEGIGKLMEGVSDKSRVELMDSGYIQEISPDAVGFFFKNVRLKKAQKRMGSSQSVVDFSLTFKANLAI